MSSSRRKSSTHPPLNVDDQTFVERFSTVVCFGTTSHVGIAIYAPLDFLLCLIFFLCLVSLIPHKFISDSDIKRFNIASTNKTIFTGARINQNLPKHILEDKAYKHAKSVYDKCHLPYIIETSAAQKGSHLQTWLSLTIIGQLLFLGGSIPLFRVRGGDIHHSHEGRQFCNIFFIFQPLAFAFMFAGLHLMVEDKTLCEFDVVFGFCCARPLMYYGFIIAMCTYKFHQIFVVIVYYKEVGIQLIRHEILRKQVAQSKGKEKCERNVNKSIAPDAASPSGSIHSPGVIDSSNGLPHVVPEHNTKANEHTVTVVINNTNTVKPNEHPVKANEHPANANEHPVKANEHTVNVIVHK